MCRWSQAVFNLCTGLALLFGTLAALLLAVVFTLLLLLTFDWDGATGSILILTSVTGGVLVDLLRDATDSG